MFKPSSVRRLAALVLLCVMTPVAYAGAACAGWSGSAQARMACCDRAGGGCASVSADECCSDGEQRQHQTPVPALVFSTGASVSVAVQPPACVPRSFILDPRSFAARPDTYLLDSTFLL